MTINENIYWMTHILSLSIIYSRDIQVNIIYKTIYIHLIVLIIETT